MFIPFDILLPILFKRTRKIQNCVGFGFLNSCIIEMVRFVTPKLKDKLKEDIFQSVRVSSEKISKLLLQNTRIICLSEKFDSVLMWSHYTDSHKGFCIAYKKSVITEAEVYTVDNSQIKKKPLLLPVNYVDKQVDLTEEVSEYVRAYKIEAHIHAYSFFGGVTRILVPDNLKTDVIKNTRAELVLNRSYHEMAEHYGTGI